MKKYRCIAVVLCICCFFVIPVRAEQTDTYVQQHLENSGAKDVWDALSEETKALYETVGVENLSDLSDTVLSPQTLLDTAGDLFKENAQTPFSTMGILLCAVVLCAYVGGLKEAVGEQGIHSVYQSVSMLTVCVAAAVPFVQCMQAVQKALSGAAVFMGSFSPVYIAVLSASGQLRAAASYQTVVLLFSQILTFLADTVLLPLLLTAFSLGMVATVSDAGHLGKIGDTLLKSVTWLTGILATVFATLLTVNGMLGSAADTLGNRMARLSLSSFVPVVGGALSEAFLTVSSCVGVVRTTVGAFGIITTALMLLPALVQCVCWQLCLWVCGMATDVFGLSAVGKLLKTMGQVMKTAVALLAVCALFMVIATAIVAKGASA